MEAVERTAPPASDRHHTTPVRRRLRTITRTWPADSDIGRHVRQPRDDLVTERPSADREFVQHAGPFTTYRRTVTSAADGAAVTERTTYRFDLPWFAWLYAIPVRWAIARRGERAAHVTPWWSPPDRVTPAQLAALGLLAAASMSSAFVNTLFTQTVEFAADDFGVGSWGVGVAGALVRAGIVLILPIAAAADRIGRRRVIVAMAVAAPVITAAGALSPSFPVLVATQTIGRPLGLALGFLIGVVAAEEVPRNSRAYALSVLALAGGFGAGIAVGSLPLADIGRGSWRLVYLVTLVWLLVAVDLARRLPESTRFVRPHAVAPRIDRRRFAVLAVVAVLSNVFVAPASLFQNSYLTDERGFSATAIAVFTLVVATPASIGLIVGGRIADVRGRRRVIAFGLPVSAALLVGSYSIGGPPMWFTALFGGIVAGMAYPALAVYRAELFPTGGRGRAAGLLTAAALIGGIAGLLATGAMVDAGSSYGAALGLISASQVAIVAVVLVLLPETAHRELEELNPEDAIARP